MRGYNLAFVDGRVAQEPIIRELDSGRFVCSFPVAIGTGSKGNTSFIKIEVWNKLAKLAADGLKKGDRVSIIGKLKQERWEDNGKIKSQVKLVARSIVKNQPIFINNN